MAITGTNKLQENSGTNATSYTTSGTVALTAGKLYIVTVQSAKSSGSHTVPTVSHSVAGSLTAINGDKDSPSTSFDQIDCFSILPGSNQSAGTFTANFGTTMVCCSFSVEEFDGVASSGTIVQSATAKDPGSGQTSGSATLAAFGDATNNATFAAVSENTTGESITAEGGYTQLSNFTGTSPARSMSVAYKVGQDTSPSFSWTTANFWVIVAFEIKAAGGATTNQAVTATLPAATASIQNQVGKVVSVALPAATATVTRSVGKIVSATLPAASATITKQIGKPITVTLPAATASIRKQVGKLVSVTLPAVAATLLATKAFLVTLTATTSLVTATIRRSVGKQVVAALPATGATISRTVAKTITATTSVVTAILVAGRALLLALTATVTSSAILAAVYQAVGSFVSFFLEGNPRDAGLEGADRNTNLEGDSSNA